MAGANNEYPLMDGFAPSWADIKCTLQASDVALLELADIKSVASGSTVEIGHQKHGGRPYSTSVGELSHDCKMSLYATGATKLFRNLKDAALAQGFVRDGGVAQISLVHFTFGYMFTPPGTVNIYEQLWKGCRLLNDSEAPAEGTDVLSVDMSIYVRERIRMIDGVQVSLL